MLNVLLVIIYILVPSINSYLYNNERGSAADMTFDIFGKVVPSGDAYYPPQRQQPQSAWPQSQPQAAWPQRQPRVQLQPQVQPPVQQQFQQPQLRFQQPQQQPRYKPPALQPAQMQMRPQQPQHIHPPYVQQQMMAMNAPQPTYQGNPQINRIIHSQAHAAYNRPLPADLQYPGYDISAPETPEQPSPNEHYYQSMGYNPGVWNPSKIASASRVYLR